MDEDWVYASGDFRLTFPEVSAFEREAEKECLELADKIATELSIVTLLASFGDPDGAAPMLKSAMTNAVTYMEMRHANKKEN